MTNTNDFTVFAENEVLDNNDGTHIDEQKAEVTDELTVTDNIRSDETEESFSFDQLKKPVKPLWKILFSIGILLCIGASIYFSFDTLSLDRFEYRENDDGYTLYAFHNDSSTKEMTIDYVYEKEGTQWIANTDKCITSIREYAFCCDNDIEVITIGKTVLSIEDNAFYSCASLKCIFVDPENPNFSSDNGILYNKDKTKIIQFPINYISYSENTLKYSVSEHQTDGSDINVEYMRYVLPNTVREVSPLCFAYVKNLTDIELSSNLEVLGDLSFFKCSSLKSIDLPDSLREIGSDCFSYNKNFKTVYIPASITAIGHHAFYECSNMTDINIALSEDEFKHNVKTGDYWKDSSLLKSININYDQTR